MNKKIQIGGMSSHNCAGTISNALHMVDGTSDVHVSLDSQQATLSVTGAVTDETLRGAVESQGYQVIDIE